MYPHDIAEIVRPDERVLVIVGAYGSGKTEIAVNLAVALARSGRKVQIGDLDLVNPYFRCREARELMESEGIRVVGDASDHKGCLIRLEYTPPRGGKSSKEPDRRGRGGEKEDHQRHVGEQGIALRLSDPAHDVDHRQWNQTHRRDRHDVRKEHHEEESRDDSEPVEDIHDPNHQDHTPQGDEPERPEIHGDRIY